MIHKFQVQCQRKVATAGGLQHSTGTSTDHQRHDYADALMLRMKARIVVMIILVQVTLRFAQRLSAFMPC